MLLTVRHWLVGEKVFIVYFCKVSMRDTQQLVLSRHSRLTLLVHMMMMWWWWSLSRLTLFTRDYRLLVRVFSEHSFYSSLLFHFLTLLTWLGQFSLSVNVIVLGSVTHQNTSLVQLVSPICLTCAARSSKTLNKLVGSMCIVCYSFIWLLWLILVVLIT